MLPRSGSTEQPRLEREQLGASTRRGGADAHARLELGGATEGVARIVALEVGAHDEPGGIARGHVLRRVHRNVDPPGEQRLLDLLDEHPALADLAEGALAVAVPGGRDGDERDLDVVSAAERLAARSACASASLEPREPMRRSIDAPSPGRSGRSHSGSPRPNRWRMASAYSAPLASAAASFIRTVG